MGHNYALFPFTPGGPSWREARKISISELLSNRRLELLKHIRIGEVETSIKGKKYFGAGAVGDEKEGRRFQEGIAVLFIIWGPLF
ncbi:hypothetical protein GH714_014169 [Hevea brasiliensis]|uniref:Cytochrome P450 n=1 Tax=Hevea brasiliensis TaxID=3981 RepID=A0A6A6NH27_HEVBR|nr:hypothetical protein GH714_014169 [Hevea brasiliensis]